MRYKADIRAEAQTRALRYKHKLRKVKGESEGAHNLRGYFQRKLADCQDSINQLQG